MENNKIKMLVYRVLMKTDNLQVNMENCIKFGLELLENSVETENICILAGLDKKEYWDIKKYFENVLNELNIHINIFDKQLQKEYLLFTANEVLNGNTSPIDAVKELTEYHVLYGYDIAYSTYYYLSEIIDLLKEEEISYANGMTKNNINEYIKQHFEYLLKMEKMGVPDEIYKQAYCKKCEKRVIPAFNIKCPKCGYYDFFWIIYNDGMELYLKEIEI